MKILLAAALCLLWAALPASAQGGEGDRWDARITAATGEVSVHPAGGGDEVDGEAGLPLEEGDRVTTAQGATAEIALDGGSLISLSEDSDFTLENTKKSESIFSVALGSILAKIQKLGSQSLTVRSPTSVAAVRGTEFGVDVEAGASHVGVFDEGRVEVRSPSGGMEVLTPNQETSVARGEAPRKAAPLKYFEARREQMRAHVRRLETVRRDYKPQSAVQRRERRVGAMKRLRQSRQERRARGGGDVQRRRAEQRRKEDLRKKRAIQQRRRQGEREGERK
ncbi:MAG: FecR domain-containing protein [Elusimicrobiota bacterium]